MQDIGALLIALRHRIDELNISIGRWCLKHTKSLPYHEQILVRTGKWVARAAANPTEQNRRQKVLYTMSARIHELSQSSDDWCPYFMALTALHQSYEFEQDGDINKLDDAIMLYERAMLGVSEGKWVPAESNVFLALFTNSSKKSLVSCQNESLENCIDVHDRALQANYIDRRDKAAHLSNIGGMLANRYEHSRSVDDLSRAVDLLEKALQSTVETSDKARIANNLSSLLIIRHESTTRSVEDVERAIDLATDALEYHSNRSSVLNNLGSALGDRYTCTGSAADLDHAIEAIEEGLLIDVNDRPEVFPVHNGTLQANLQLMLSLRFENSGSMQDLNRATDLYDKFTKSAMSNRSQVARLNKFAINPEDQFCGIGSIEDLNHAIENYDKALAELSSEQRLPRMFVMHNLADGLAHRFERLGSIDDLDRSIALADEALETLPSQSPNRREITRNLGQWLSKRSDKIGLYEDLDRAIQITSEALRLTPKDHTDRHLCLSQLSGILARRYQRIGSIKDLDNAIETADEALHATHSPRSGQVAQLTELKYLLSYRSERTRSIADINRLVKITDELVSLIPLNHPDRTLHLADLGEALYIRFAQTQSLEDINRAIEVVDGSLQLTPLNDPIRPTRLIQLSAFFSRRIRSTGSLADIDRAIRLAEDALENTRSDSPHRLTALNNLGEILVTKLEHTRCIDDVKPFLPLFKDNWDCPHAPFSQRVLSAQTAVYLLDLDSDWEGSSTLMETAVQLLPFVSPRWLTHGDRQHQLKIHNGLPSRAAVYALREGRKPYDALKILDFGRGIVASFLMDLRGDISLLEERHPQLAAEFMRLRDELDMPSEEPGVHGVSKALYLESGQQKRRKAERRFREVHEEIRSKPNLAGFLLSISEDEMRAAAIPGPLIIVSVDMFRCDAFLVSPQEIKLLNLPDLFLEDVEERVKGLQVSRLSASYVSSMLEWLWDTVAGPCLEELGYSSTPIIGEDWPRVWWIPTGPLSHLPLHAAGHHVRGSTATVMDRVVSSYASSIKALIHGRQQPCQVSQSSMAGKALLVTMPNTPSRSPLYHAARETSMLDSLCHSLNLKPTRLQQQTREEVLGQISASTIFHFAGHGYSDPLEPSESLLLLEDWQKSPLTMGHIRDLRLNRNPSFLAYLSACSTGANKAKDLDDEGINIVSACQLAGFRHVIGTLWEVSDPICVDVAKTLYETLRDEGLTDAAVARGLHRATRRIRDRSVNNGGLVTRLERDGTLLIASKQTKELINLFWIPYVHYGV